MISHLTLALTVATSTPTSPCQVNPSRCESVIRRQAHAIQILSTRLDESEALLRLEESKTATLTEALKTPEIIVETETPWWAYLLAVAGAIGLGVGLGVGVSGI